MTNIDAAARQARLAQSVASQPVVPLDVASQPAVPLAVASQPAVPLDVVGEPARRWPRFDVALVARSCEGMNHAELVDTVVDLTRKSWRQQKRIAILKTQVS